MRLHPDYEGAILVKRNATALFIKVLRMVVYLYVLDYADAYVGGNGLVKMTLNFKYKSCDSIQIKYFLHLIQTPSSLAYDLILSFYGFTFMVLLPILINFKWKY